MNVDSPFLGQRDPKSLLHVSRDELLHYQSRQLCHTLSRAYERVPYYRASFDEHGISPKDIRDIHDLRLCCANTGQGFPV